LCSASRHGAEPTPRGPAPPLPWYFGELLAERSLFRLPPTSRQKPWRKRSTASAPACAQT
jgi:hypothetical protein